MIPGLPLLACCCAGAYVLNRRRKRNPSQAKRRRRRLWTPPKVAPSPWPPGHRGTPRAPSVAPGFAAGGIAGYVGDDTPLCPLGMTYDGEKCVPD